MLLLGVVCVALLSQPLLHCALLWLLLDIVSILKLSILMGCLPLWPAILFLLTSNLVSVLLVLVRFHDALLLRQYSTLLIWTFVRPVVLCRFVLVVRVAVRLLYMLYVDYSLILSHRQLF